MILSWQLGETAGRQGFFLHAVVVLILLVRFQCIEREPYLVFFGVIREPYLLFPEIEVAGEHFALSIMSVVLVNIATFGFLIVR